MAEEFALKKMGNFLAVFFLCQNIFSIAKRSLFKQLLHLKDKENKENYDFINNKNLFDIKN